MTQADSVHSTPRTDLSEGTPERAKRDRALSNAYMNLEGKIIDLDRMGQIAFMVAQSPDDDELLLFSVYQLHKMAANLRKSYAAAFGAASGEE